MIPKTIMITALSLATLAPVAIAGPNDFFGSNIPSGGPTGDGEGNPTVSRPSPGGAGDYTDDEKRMQKKFKASVVHAKELIAKGEAMIKKGDAHHDDKLLKKGKIFKDIGQRQLSELNAGSPQHERVSSTKGSANGM